LRKEETVSQTLGIISRSVNLFSKKLGTIATFITPDGGQNSPTKRENEITEVRPEKAKQVAGAAMFVTAPIFGMIGAKLKCSAPGAFRGTVQIRARSLCQQGGGSSRCGGEKFLSDEESHRGAENEGENVDIK